MKIFLSVLAICLIHSSFSEAYRVIYEGPTTILKSTTEKTNGQQIQSGQYSYPMSTECASIIHPIVLSQIKFLDEQQARLKQELQLNQQDRALLVKITEIAQRTRSAQSDEKPQEVPNDYQKIIPNIISKTQNVAGDILNTAGQLAKDDIDLKKSLISGAVGGAGKTAESSLHKTGQVAAHAGSNIEDGYKNIFGNFGK